MIELSINQVTKYFGATKIFENISFDLQTGERLGLIGANGCGKTTLMKMIMGTESRDAGQIALRKDAKVGYLNQMPVYEPSVSVKAVLDMAFEEIFKLKQEMEALEHQLACGQTADSLLQRYGSLSERFERAGGYETEMLVGRIAEGLNISTDMQEMAFEALSGGEKTRVILGKILLEQPDILLLDEPSNHLDLSTIEWLETFLADYKGTVLFISHDRHFLDRVAGRIVELEASRAVLYNGNYSYYVAEKERRFLIAYRDYLNQQRKIENMERQIQRYRIWGEMRDSEKMFKRAKELEKRLEKMESIQKPVLEKRKVVWDQEKADRSGKIVLDIRGVRKSFTATPLFEDIDLTVYYQDSIGLLGSNGCGKSTLLKMIMGELDPEAGTIKLGASLKLGYLPQEVAFEDEEQTLVKYFAARHEFSEGEARSQLARMLFMKEDVNKKIKSLSGGEKSRLKLGSLTLEGVNCLILDEPTNHLDIESREVLEEMLMEFAGTILFVSHDRYFIEKIASRILVIEAGRMSAYAGDYGYYLEEKAKPGRDRADAADQNQYNRKTPRRTETPSNKSPISRKKLQQQIETLEVEIEGAESRCRALEGSMEANAENAQVLIELLEEKARLTETIEGQYRKWEEFNLLVNISEF